MTQSQNNSLSKASILGLENHIYQLRGYDVMIDHDLAEIYGVEPKVIKQTVKRNIDRFPSDFMFQLDQSEVEKVRSQNVTEILKSKIEPVANPQVGSQKVTESMYSKPMVRKGIRYAPFVFTELGVAMLSSILKSERAIKMNIAIMRAFVELRSQEIRKRDNWTPRLDSIDSKIASLSERLEEFSCQKISQHKVNKDSMTTSKLAGSVQRGPSLSFGPFTEGQGGSKALAKRFNQIFNGK